MRYILTAIFSLILIVVMLSLADSKTTIYPELYDLENNRLSFRYLSNYFNDLAEKKGASYAYEVLKAAPMPPGIDMHLLGHVVGDALYQQEGAGGMSICTHDFRNACSHSIVIGLLVEKGEKALPEINESCKLAPGGSGAYTMCFHGLGHGVLAYAGYDLLKAVELCKKTGTPEYHNAESSQCISGAIMEIIGGGFNDPLLWKEQSKKYFKDDNPLYPCASDFIPNEAKPLCYVYLTPHLFKLAGANLARPTALDFEKAFLFCGTIPEHKPENRDACYGGFGKEFIVLAKDRDIRNIENMTDQELLKVYRWCLLAHGGQGVKACLHHALQSLYWGGENNRRVAIRFCELVRDSFYQSPCFENLIGAVSFYINERGYRQSFCKELPFIYQKECLG
ncbi:hypothetical protein IIA95_04270, partial [Patescibacteria group bacterium]|nr:hypothetical protein [Patescibacteria group bacterium]